MISFHVQVYLEESLYGSFGSKQGMFILALELAIEKDIRSIKLDLIMVALLEVSSNSNRVHQILKDWYLEKNSEQVIKDLGLQLLRHGKLI